METSHEIHSEMPSLQFLYLWTVDHKRLHFELHIHIKNRFTIAEVEREMHENRTSSFAKFSLSFDRDE
jgi:hypothetical protein